MSSGFVSAGLAIGLGALSSKPQRGFITQGGSLILPHATLEEVHHDEIEITDNPVEQGSNISDHAFLKPCEVIIRFGFSDSPPSTGGVLGTAIAAASGFSPIVAKVSGAIQTISAIGSLLTGNGESQVKTVYKAILDIQATLIPFTIYTGKRKYENMLFKSISVTTDIKNENSMIVTATCRQVIIVNTTVVKTPVNANAQAKPKFTDKVKNMGTQALKSAVGKFIA